MAMNHLFVSYSRHDQAFVDRLVKYLKDASMSVWIDHEGLSVGTKSWELAIREAIRNSFGLILIASPNSNSSRYVRDEMQIADMYSRKIYPVWAVGDDWRECVPLGNFELQYVDCREGKFDTGIGQLLSTLQHDNDPMTGDTATPNIIAPVSDPMTSLRNPYKGLRAFTSDDHNDFFGRDAFINEVMGDIRRRLHASENPERFMAFIGPSGSGKSSMVMAGLIPKLQQGAINGSEAWIYLPPIYPASSPLEALANALAASLEMGMRAIMEDLTYNLRGLHNLLERVKAKQSKPRDAKVVLLVDQFEELFTLTYKPEDRNTFIELLYNAATERTGSALIFITLRADFYDRPMNHTDFGKLLESNNRSILPMTLRDLREIIEKPAEGVNLQFDDGLVGDLIFEVYGQSGALPLLQFTLDQLFRRRDVNRLTLDAYHEMNGVKGALAEHAEGIYQNRLMGWQRKFAKHLFLRLIEPGETELGTTRRRAEMSEFIDPDPEYAEELRTTINLFVNERLLTISNVRDIQILEVSHEALIREWTRLADWLHEKREDVIFHNRLSNDTKEWLKQGQSPDRLYRGSMLEAAANWLHNNHPSDMEYEFIERSLQRAEQDRQFDRMLTRHATELDDMIEHIIQNSLSILRVKRCDVLLLDGFRRDFTKYELDRTSKYDQVIQSQVAVDANPTYQQVLASGEIIRTEADDTVKIVAPLRRIDNFIGVLEFEVEAERYRHDAHVVTRFASQSAILLSNTLQYLEAGRQASEFASSVTHELRTPMTTIKGYVDLLLMGAAGEVNDSQARFLETLKQNADRLSIVVNDLLLISKHDQDDQLDIALVDVSEVVHGAVAYTRNALDKHEAKRDILATVSTDLPKIWLDADKIGQVLIQLLTNAINFSGDGSTITIGVHQDYYEIVFSVKDEGIGIPPDVGKRVFQRFYRVVDNDELVVDANGTGLGLAIAKSFVDMHSGRIWYESEVNKGTIFYFSFPLYDETVAE